MVEYWHLEQEGAVMKKKRIWAGLLLLVAVFLTACSAGDEKPEPELPPEPESSNDLS